MFQKKSILITGSKGFIARNLITKLNNYATLDIYEFSRENNIDDLKAKVSEINFIFHLAGEVKPNSKDNKRLFSEKNTTKWP